MTKLYTTDIQADVEAVNSIPIVNTLLEVVCRTTGMGFAAIARVTEDSWVACSVRDEINFGLKPGGELKLETTICNEIRHSHKAVIIEHVEKDEIYAVHQTPAMYGFQSYISVPIFLKDGSFFGTLCAIDPRPALINTPEVIGMFNMMVDLISFHLNAVEQLTLSRQKLLEEQKTAELREQFIAVLGHDLRNPLTAISGIAQLLLQMPIEEQAKKLVGTIKNSSTRMNGLIENILDFAHGRLGGGVTLNRMDNEPLAKILNHVIDELQVIWPGRNIETHFALSKPVNCDGKRIAQLFSNLLGNALSYGKANEPVTITAVSNSETFTLSVANKGDKIPDTVLERIFEPFSRGEVERGQKGLGLGLYIALEIAKAHGGVMEVMSTQEFTQFTFRMPAK